jgi:hypothetical protein
MSPYVCHHCGPFTRELQGPPVVCSPVHAPQIGVFTHPCWVFGSESDCFHLLSGVFPSSVWSWVVAVRNQTIDLAYRSVDHISFRTFIPHLTRCAQRSGWYFVRVLIMHDIWWSCLRRKCSTARAPSKAVSRFVVILYLLFILWWSLNRNKSSILTLTPRRGSSGMSVGNVPAPSRDCAGSPLVPSCL